MDEKTTAIVVFGIAYFLIATGRIPHVLIAVLGGGALIFLGVLSEEEALEHVDLEVILLLAGMMSLAYVVGRTGVFDWAALRSAQLVRGDGFWTLCLLAVMTAVASAFLDNVTVVVLAVPITLSLCRTLNLNPVPFLLSQVFASNIGGAATVVGDPPNIIIASKAGIGFVEFMTNVAPVSILSMGALLVLLYVWFRRDVVASEASRREIMSQSPAEAIKDRGLLIKSGVVLGLTVLGFLLQDVINVRPAFVAFTGAGVIVPHRSGGPTRGATERGMDHARFLYRTLHTGGWTGGDRGNQRSSEGARGPCRGQRSDPRPSDRVVQRRRVRHRRQHTLHRDNGRGHRRPAERGGHGG